MRGLQSNGALLRGAPQYDPAGEKDRVPLNPLRNAENRCNMPRKSQ